MTQITFQQLKKLSKTDASALPQYSLAVLGDCATQHLATALRGYGVSAGIRLNVFDADYYRRPVSELVREEQFDNILVCYNCLNFLTDTNLPTLK